MIFLLSQPQPQKYMTRYKLEKGQMFVFPLQRSGLLVERQLLSENVRHEKGLANSHRREMKCNKQKGSDLVA